MTQSAPIKPGQRWLSERQALDYFKMSRIRLNRLRRAYMGGDISRWLRDGHIFYDKEELDRWADDHRTWVEPERASMGASFWLKILAPRLYTLARKLGREARKHGGMTTAQLFTDMESEMYPDVESMIVSQIMDSEDPRVPDWLKEWCARRWGTLVMERS